MKTDKFTVIRDGLKINGLEHLNDNEKAPCIIMSHGFQCNYAGFDYYAEKFYEYGFSVFRFNFCGGSSRDDFEGKSDGDSRDMCLSSEVKDLLTVFDYVEKTAGEERDIYLLGESQGAFVSGLAAARLGCKVKKLIMIFPAVCIPDHARRGTLGGAKYDPKNPPEEMVLPLTTIGKKFHEDVVELDAYSELAKYPGETLIIQGTDDDIVVPQYQYIVKDWFDKTDVTAKHRCQLQMVRNMGHMCHPDYIEGLFASMRMFIEEKREVLTFRIIITELINLDGQENKLPNNANVSDKGTLHFQDILFTGYSEGDLFTGTITKGVDHQIYNGNECLQMRAEYTFSGVDMDGNPCTIDVINKKELECEQTFNDWKPEIKTDSEKLKWLENTELTAVLEGGKLGPTIRVYC